MQPVLSALYFSHSIHQITSIIQANSLLITTPDEWDEITGDHLFVIIITVFSMKLQFRDHPVGPHGLINQLKIPRSILLPGCSIPKTCLCPILVNSARSFKFGSYSRVFPLPCLISKQNLTLSLQDLTAQSPLLHFPHVTAQDQAPPHSVSRLWLHLPPNFHASQPHLPLTPPLSHL